MSLPFRKHDFDDVHDFSETCFGIYFLMSLQSKLVQFGILLVVCSTIFRDLCLNDLLDGLVVDLLCLLDTKVVLVLRRRPVLYVNFS